MSRSSLSARLGKASSSARKKKKGRRGGWLDVILVCITLLAAWTRTPVGGLIQYGWERATVGEAEFPSLTAYFFTGQTSVEAAALVVDRAFSTTPVPENGFPEPYRTAVLRTWNGRLPPAARDQIQELNPDAKEEEAVLALLDKIYEGDPQVALEVLAIGAEKRDRAVARAKATGVAHPERFSSHRRFLPAREQRHGEKYIESTLALGNLLDLHWPVLTAHRVTSGWGYRVNPVLKKRKFHNGVDLGVPIGTPIHAVQDGRVAVASTDRVNGNYLVLDHGHGVRTSYCHLDALKVQRHDPVVQGDIIALSGNTGRSTGPHLHFVVRVGKKTVDPQPLRRPTPSRTKTAPKEIKEPSFVAPDPDQAAP